jgi:hypothetical protein
MATQEEMSRYFWSASTNCPPVRPLRSRHLINMQKRAIGELRGLGTRLDGNGLGFWAISYPEPSLSGSGHTGLKNDPDWSIHKLLDPYPLWRSRARPIWVNTIYFTLFGLKICLFWRIFCCFSSEKVMKGLWSWFMYYLNSFGQNNRLRYGNNSYSLFTLSEYWWEWWHMSLIYYIGVLLLKTNLSVQDLQAYTYAMTVFVQDLGFFNWTVNVYPGPEVFLGLATAKCEKTREEKGKTSGEFVSDSWFG